MSKLLGISGHSSHDVRTSGGLHILSQYFVSKADFFRFFDSKKTGWIYGTPYFPEKHGETIRCIRCGWVGRPVSGLTLGQMQCPECSAPVTFNALEEKPDFFALIQPKKLPIVKTDHTAKTEFYEKERAEGRIVPKPTPMFLEREIGTRDFVKSPVGVEEIVKGVDARNKFLESLHQPVVEKPRFTVTPKITTPLPIPEILKDGDGEAGTKLTVEETAGIRYMRKNKDASEEGSE